MKDSIMKYEDWKRMEEKVEGREKEREKELKEK